MLLNDQVVQFTDVDVISVEKDESPDGMDRVVLVLRGQSVPGGGETLTRIQAPFRPEFAVQIGEAMAMEGRRLQGELPSGIITAKPADIGPTAQAVEQINGNGHGG